MKCKNCGAPIVSRVCEYCGTEHKEYIEGEYITIPINGRDIKFYKCDIKMDCIYPFVDLTRDTKGMLHKMTVPKYIYTLTLVSESLQEPYI